FQAEDGIRDFHVTGVQTCALPISKNYLIRIDELTNDNYRYASWKIGEKESSKPDIIIDNGKLKFEGSGGNHVIIFTNDEYTYKVDRKSTRLNSSHVKISYAVFCLK